MIDRDDMAANAGLFARTGMITGAGLLALLTGCKTPPNLAPVEDRPARPVASRPAAEAAVKPAPAAAPVATTGADGRVTTYIVKPGDHLSRIGLETGQSWKDLARWNNLDDPNRIEVGQVLRVVPPAGESAVAQTRPLAPAKVETRPLDARPAASAASAAVAASTQAAAASAASAAAAVREDDDLNWAWPAAGPVSTPFDDNRSKGLGIGGKAGDPVLAAADGRVVYAGSGLRGYGNLVIIKHNNTYLTAYAHNQTLLVKEDQAVKRGQKIAEMGATDTDKVHLHFEIRRQGKPIDPAKLLPAR